jgi:transcriptional regulator with XRE-family HTH domain
MKSKLRIARVTQGLRQKDVEKWTGIIQSRISMIENGLIEPRYDEKERLAKVLKTTVKMLFPAKIKKGKFNGLTILTQRGAT